MRVFQSLVLALLLLSMIVVVADADNNSHNNNNNNINNINNNNNIINNNINNPNSNSNNSNGSYRETKLRAMIRGGGEGMNAEDQWNKFINSLISLGCDAAAISNLHGDVYYSSPGFELTSNEIIIILHGYQYLPISWSLSGIEFNAPRFINNLKTQLASNLDLVQSSLTILNEKWLLVVIFDSNRSDELIAGIESLAQQMSAASL